jgi:hypothetical protein
MSAFPLPLDMRPMWNADGTPMTNRSGRRIFEIQNDFPVNHPKLQGGQRVIKKGFFTDLDSIPRIPLIYDELSGLAIEPYIFHDDAYMYGYIPRDLADEILRDLLISVGVDHLKADMIYAGVRLGGAGHYGTDYTA